MKELEYPIRSVPKGRRFCTVCGEIKRESHFEGDSTHCDTCCEKMRHTRPRVYGVLTFAVLLLIGAAAMMLCVQTVRFCAVLCHADRLAENAYLYDACDAYSDAMGDLDDVNRTLLLQNLFEKEDEESSSLPSFFTAGTKTWERYASLYAQTHSEYDAASVLESSLDKKQLHANPALAAYLQAREAYEAVYEKVQAFSDLDPDAEDPGQYDELFATLDAIEQENDSRYYQGYVALFRGSAIQYFRQDELPAALEEYEKALTLLPDEYINVYRSKAEIANMQQDWASLQSVGEEMLSKNRNYTDAFTWILYGAVKQGDTATARKAAQRLHEDDPDSPLYEKMLVQIALMSGDLDAAEQAVRDGKARLDSRADTCFDTLLAKQALDEKPRQFLKSYLQFATYEGIVCLLRNDLDGAMDAAYERGFNYGYYLEYLTSDSSMTQLTIDVAWVCATMCKDEEALSLMTEMAPGYDWAQKIVDGELTLQQAFLKGEAELT